MSHNESAKVAQTADQLMRRMLNGVSRLQGMCASDAVELAKLRDERKRNIAAAEKSTREASAKAVASTGYLSEGVSLGSRLRTELGRLPQVSVKHFDPGDAPTGLEDAVAEWKRLSSTTQREVRAFQDAIGAWSQKVIKRAKSMPVLGDEVWRALDRLDLIHRSIQPLTEARVAAAVRDVAGAADVVLQAEIERQAAGQRMEAEALKGAIASVQSMVGLAGSSWADPGWNSPVPAQTVERLIRLGELQARLPASLEVGGVPALTAFPFVAGIAVGSDLASRSSAVSMLRALMLRLFAAVPPGRLHIKAVDPVSLGQSVAEYRHLSEYDSQLMDEKTWTSERDIDRLMDDLSHHLEVVISTYLRGQFETIDAYNEHAGEVAQPYRVLVIFDYPNGFSDSASKQLVSLIENGPRCGLYTLVHYDTAAMAPEHRADVSIERLIHGMQRVTFRAGNQGVGTDLPGVGSQSTAVLELPAPVGEVKLELIADEAAPVAFNEDGDPETGFAMLLPRIGASVRRALAAPPAVTLESLLPVLSRARSGVLPDFESSSPAFTTDPASWWRASTLRSAVAPIGRTGAQAVTSMYFSSTEVAGGAIVVGLPRSGKTTSLHAMILTLSMLYSPEELEFYLIDAKHGVEFKAYEHLPHARLVSVHSEREFSLAVLKSIEKEIQRRAELMKAHGAGLANITEYRNATGEKLPRIVVVVDEFHELFEEADEMGLAAFAAFSNIVRMGPFSGAHIVVASQTLSNMPAMDRPTLTLLPQRVAFMCNEYDAEIVMGEGNKATRSLAKTGDGVFNPSRGEESKNQPFQGLYIPPEERAAVLRQLSVRASELGWARQPRVFDGDTVVERQDLATTFTPGPRFSVPVGEPFTLAAFESLVFARTRGANLLVLGDGDEDDSSDLAARGVVHSVLLAAQAQRVAVTLVDFIGDEQIGDASTVMQVAAATGAQYVRSRSLESVVQEIGSTVVKRLEAEDYRAPTQLLVLFGLHRALSLAPPDPYGDDEGAPSLSKSLLAILADGPEVGVHVVIDANRGRSVEMRLGSDVLAELTLRVAGSEAEQRDLGLVVGSFGDVPPLRYGQLILGDQLKGTVKRVRGYRIVSERPSAQVEESSNV